MEIGRLTDVDPRNAWAHEAQNFTPWLAANMDRLSEAIGAPLELQGTEVAVESFSADILARNLATGDLVLIENQLETTDHRHLGQILTYLAGLEAKTVVWIATEFREPHISALKWLNENTAEAIAFFGVKLRTVKIGDSPIAPVFDVLVRPNQWEKHLQSVVRSTESANDVSRFREEFWNAYLDRFPDDRRLGIVPGKISSAWLPVDEAQSIIITLYVGKSTVGAFVRGPRGSDGEELARRFDPIRGRLERELGTKYGRKTGSSFFDRGKKFDMTDRANWPAAIDWLHGIAMTYLGALRNVLPEVATASGGPGAAPRRG